MPFDLDITTSLLYKEGEAGLLMRMLESEFGALPDATMQRINQGSKEQIEHWAIRALRARSLAEVFGDPIAVHSPEK